MKKKMVTALLAAVVTGSLLLSGCGGSSGASSSGGSNASSDAAKEETKEEEAAEDTAAADTAAAPAAGAQTWNIGTSSSGAFYYVGTAIAQIVTPELTSQGLTIVSEASNGSIENARRLNSGEIMMGIVPTWNMDAEIEAGNVQAENLNYIIPLYTNYLHYMTPPATGVKTMAEAMQWAKDNKASIGCGEPGSGYYQQWQWTLDSFGLSMDDISEQRISPAECVDLMKDGDLNFMVINSGLYNSQVSDLASSISGGIQLLAWTDEEIASFQEKSPCFFATDIPGGIYEGNPEDTHSLAFKPVLYCRADLDEELVYQFTKAMCEHTEEMGAIYEPCLEITKEAGGEMKDVYEADGIKMHPGAERYFREVGVLQ